MLIFLSNDRVGADRPEILVLHSLLGSPPGEFEFTPVEMSEVIHGHAQREGGLSANPTDPSTRLLQAARLGLFRYIDIDMPRIFSPWSTVPLGKALVVREELAELIADVEGVRLREVEVWKTLVFKELLRRIKPAKRNCLIDQGTWMKHFDDWGVPPPEGYPTRAWEIEFPHVAGIMDDPSRAIALTVPEDFLRLTGRLWRAAQAPRDLWRHSAVIECKIGFLLSPVLSERLRPLLPFPGFACMPVTQLD